MAALPYLWIRRVHIKTPNLHKLIYSFYAFQIKIPEDISKNELIDCKIYMEKQSMKTI